MKPKDVTIKLAFRRNVVGEFEVKRYENGAYRAPATYFTDDWDDAVGTAEYMREEADHQGHNVTLEIKR